jgi:enoyl-CoA hydratase
LNPTLDYAAMKRNTENFMALWRCTKPTIAKVHGYAVAGGSDIALCCDMLVMADDAKIGYMPTRVWGCPTTAMWTYRLGAIRAKQLMFTGDTISGVKAAEWAWQICRCLRLNWTVRRRLWPSVLQACPART